MMEIIRGKLKTVRCDVQCIVVVGSIGTLLWGLLFYFWLHKPLYAAAEEYACQSATTSREVTQIINFRNAHLHFEEYQEELGKREKRVLQYLPADIGQGEFILTVERLAMRSKIQLEKVSPQKVVTDADKICQPVKVGLTGSYFGLLNFIQALQSGERLVMIENMSVKVKGANLTVDMLLNIYAVPAK